MYRIVPGFVAVALVFAGWRNLPRLDDTSSLAAGLLLAGAVVLAFIFGRRSVNAEAVATAVASARAEAAAVAHAGAQAHSQVVVNVGGEPAPDGARAIAMQTYGRPEWIGPGRHQVEQLEGSDALDSVMDEMREFAVDREDG